jgi:uncharacterized protein with beta-barrel porin domain
MFQSRRRTAQGRFGKRTLLLASFLLLSSASAALAHTVSVGYEALGGGIFDIWYGTYHAPSQANYTEGSLQFVGPSVSTTVAFTMLVTTKPGGLIDGQTNFYSNASGTALTGTPVPVSGNTGSFNGLASSVLVWQGVQFTGITRPGTYTFTYIPIANPTDVWDPINNAILTGSFTITAQQLGTTVTSLLPPGSPTNVLNVAGAIDNFVGSGGTLSAALQNLYDLSPAQLSAAMSQLSGEAATDAEKGAFEMMGQFLGLMLDPFVDGRGCGGAQDPRRDPLTNRPDCSDGAAHGFAPEQQADFPPDIALAYAKVLKAPPEVFTQRWTAWGSGFGGYNKTSGDAVTGSNSVTARDYGFAGGMDYHFSPDTVAGFALAGGGTNWGLAQGLGGGRSDAFQTGLYGMTRSGPAYLAAAFAFTNNWMVTNRTSFAGDQLDARFDAQSYGARLETGYRYATPGLGVTPYAALQAQDFHTPRYSETDLTGGGFGVSYNSMTANDARGELGARFDNSQTFNGMPVTLRARAAWAHDWVSNPALDATFETLPGASFVVNGATQPKNSALASAGAELFMTKYWSLLAKFDGEFASGSQTYSGTGTLRYTW